VLHLCNSTEYRANQIVPLRYKRREIKSIIIDPNGLGPDKPSIGMGFRGMDRQIGISRQTLSDRVSEIEEEKYLELSSGSTFRVMQIDIEETCPLWIISGSSVSPLAITLALLTTA
jgi:hypothetical protein